MIVSSNMSVSSRHEGNLRNVSELLSDNINEGTSARTRPYSYEDIMLRRKNKNAVVETQDLTVADDKEEQIVSKPLCDLESEKNGRENSRSIRSTIVSLDSRRVSSRTKDDNASSLRESKLVNDTAEQSQDYKKTMSNSDKNNLTGGNTRGKLDRYIDTRDTGGNTRGKLDRYIDTRDTGGNTRGKLDRYIDTRDTGGNTRGKLDRYIDTRDTGGNTRGKLNRYIDTKDTGGNTRGKLDRHIDIKDRQYTDSRERWSNHHSKDASDERHLRDLSHKDMISASKSTKKYDKDRSRNELTHEDDRIGNKKRSTDQSSLDYEGQLKKRHSRGWVGKESHRDSDRPQLDKAAPKKKHEDVFGEKGRERDAKKLHPRSSRNLDLPEKNSERNRKDNPQTHYEDPIQLSKRSRKTETDDDRDRLQPSISSRGHRHSKAGNQELEISPTHPAKDRSEKDNPDVERKRISSNGTNRRYPESSSGLGGYSPRKRKTEAAPKTPSSTNHSPEKRDSVLDLKQTKKDEDVTVPAIFYSQSSHIVSASAEKSSSINPKTSVPVGPIISSHYISSSQLHAIDSIQLTQATRPKRRLYVENLPSAASEKALMECINNFLLSSCVNYIQRTPPCISCIIHQDKGQALLEFLTPEDASAALSFDGRSFYGTTLKIRRPKDFIEVTTGVPDKSAEVTNSVSDAVENSSNKVNSPNETEIAIFIGGISKLISSEMLIDIAKAFGPLKAFHFEHNTDIDAQITFLEYSDSLITIKACAGLNGMKLGGQVLTVVQAIPETLLPRNDRHPSLYTIPDNAKPLMEKPTEILKLKNMVDLEGLPSLSEAEVEEISEDIRLECTRFGTVTAVNVVKCRNDSCAVEASAAMDGNVGYREALMVEAGGDGSEHEMNNTVDSEDDLSANNTVDETRGSLSSDEKPSPVKVTSTDEMLVGNDKVYVSDETSNRVINGEEGSLRLEVGTCRSKNECEVVSEFWDMFETGCVLVEFKRVEASCMAAHSLHGRLFGDRVVSVEYVSPDLYLKRFSK